jgi:F0F1-type ATP synthase assembly protein I
MKSQLGQNNTQKRPKKQGKQTIMRFAGLGTTLAASIGLGAIGGRKLDEYFALEKPLITAAGALLGLAIGMWSVLRNIKSM